MSALAVGALTGGALPVAGRPGAGWAARLGLGDAGRKPSSDSRVPASFETLIVRAIVLVGRAKPHGTVTGRGRSGRRAPLEVGVHQLHGHRALAQGGGDAFD